MVYKNRLADIYRQQNRIQKIKSIENIEKQNYKRIDHLILSLLIKDSEDKGLPFSILSEY